MFSKKILAIDIGNKNIKIVSGNHNKDSIMIDKAITIETPVNSYEDGNILDVSNLKKAIGLALENEKIKAKKVIFTVDSTSIITRDISLPLAKKEEEMDTMVRFEIEQYLPIMFDDYVVEYKILEEFMEENIKKARILVVALPKIIAEEYLKLIARLKLTPLALDVNSNSISKLFEMNGKINMENYSLNKTVSVIDLGYNYLNVNIISKGITEFSRLIPVGGSEIDINIANMFNLSLEEAENKKIEDCDLQYIYSGSDSRISSQMLNDTVKGSIDSWLQEIGRIFQYFINRHRENKIEEIYLYGGGSNIKGLPEYFKSVLDIPTFKVENISNIKFAKGAKNANVQFYLNSIGSIIRK